MPTTTTLPAPRACWWLTRPDEMADGRLLGYLGVRVGKAKDFYRAVRVSADDLEVRWELSKELPDGSFAAPYAVRLPVNPRTTPVCSCPGWKFGGTCRHTKALTALTTAATVAAA